MPVLATDPMPDGMMPDLRGLSARKALRVATRAGLIARLEGSGFVTEQSPAAGTPLGSDEVCELTLRRTFTISPGGDTP